MIFWQLRSYWGGVAINFLSSDSVRYSLWDCTVVGESTDLVGSWANNSSLIAWWIIIFNEAKILCWVDCLRVRFCLPEFADIAEDKYRTNPFRYLTSTSFNRIRSPLYFFRWYINIRREPGTPFLPIFCLLLLTCSMYCIKLTSGFLLVNPCRSLKNSTVLWVDCICQPEGFLVFKSVGFCSFGDKIQMQKFVSTISSVIQIEVQGPIPTTGRFTSQFYDSIICHNLFLIFTYYMREIMNRLNLSGFFSYIIK